MSVPRPRGDVLAGTNLFVIDGSNQRPRNGSADPPEEPALVGRLRAIIPPSIRIALVLDSDPPPGTSTVRTVAGVTIRHARGGNGDNLVVSLARTDPTRTVVVTDDRELRRRVTRIGARVEGNDWLRRLRERGRALAPSVGGRRPPAAARSDKHDTADADSDDAPRWRPGRGATVKRGNPKRQPRRR